MEAINTKPPPRTDDPQFPCAGFSTHTQQSPESYMWQTVDMSSRRLPFQHHPDPSLKDVLMIGMCCCLWLANCRYRGKNGHKTYNVCTDQHMSGSETGMKTWFSIPGSTFYAVQWSCLQRCLSNPLLPNSHICLEYHYLSTHQNLANIRKDN